MIEKSEVICSERGTCSFTSNPSCNCDSEYNGINCETRTCKNDCSNDQISDPNLKSKCIEAYPESYCQCSYASKRGGDDCSKIFCLNDCGIGGTCQNGTCICTNYHSGPDCSVFEIQMYLE